MSLAEVDSTLTEKGGEVGMSEWISVKDRLPECDHVLEDEGMEWGESKEVVVYGITPDGVKAYGIASYMTDPNDKDWFEWNGIVNNFDDAIHCKITHWMPLPEPPQEEDDGN